MTMFELALDYTQTVVDLGDLYHDQDRSACQELWIRHDAVYKALWEAQQAQDEIEKKFTEVLRQGAIQLGKFQNVCNDARSYSSVEECHAFVNAVVSKSWPHEIESYSVSDWYNSDSTVATYFNGEKQE